MREAHAHLFQLGRALGMVDLSGCGSADEMLARLAERAGSRPGEPVLAHGARPEGFDRPGWPGPDELERACGGAAVWAWCFDHHALQASVAALRLAGVAENEPDPSGGAFERDANGRLTGVCLESAALRVWASAPAPSASERVAMLRAAVLKLAARGFAEVHDLKAQPWVPGVLRTLEAAGDLACDVVLWPLVDDLPEMAGDR